MIKIGIIGAGQNAAGHAKYFHQSPRTRVIAVADPVSERAEALATEVGARAVTDYLEFLDDVDAVVISSPNFLHRDQAVAAASAGKHVYCEKPMGINLVEAREIVSAVDAAGVKSTVGFAVRFDGTIQTMLRMSGAGELGPLVSVVSRRLMYMRQSPAASWRTDHALSGGLMFEINIHELDWMLWAGGEVESVYARTWARDPQGPRSNDHAWVTINFKNGGVGYHEGSWAAATPQFYRNLIGRDAGLNTDEWGGKLFLARNGSNREAITSDPSFDIRANFLDSIDEIATPVADVHWGVKVMALTEAIFDSAASKLPVAVAAC